MEFDGNVPHATEPNGQRLLNYLSRLVFVDGSAVAEKELEHAYQCRRLLLDVPLVLFLTLEMV